MEEEATGPGELAVRLRRLREAASLTQEELATRAGLTAKAIGALERGERRRPYPHTVRSLADALELDDDDRAALVAASSGRSSPTEPPPAAARPTGLPVSPVRLVGRRADHDRAVAALGAGDVRLLTITGPGGVGKTTLAVAVARTLAAELPGDVTYVELASVAEPGLVLPTIARALGGSLVGGPAVDALAASIGQRRHLLLLDNFEHLLDAARDVAALLARCPGLQVLVTSRAPLRVRAEHAVPLDPLSLPSGDDAATVADSAAAQVFLERAEAAGRTLTLSGQTAADVAAICRRLDGLPLALELAAAHTRLLTPSALLRHLDKALSAPGSRDLPARQRTVRATLDWSHDLLTSDEQVLLRRLSVLAGPFSLDAATAVGGDEVEVLHGLSGLVEQSLLLPLPGPAARYRFLEPVRQHAAERLALAGETELAADRAAAHFVALAAGAGDGLRGPHQISWLDRLAAEHSHLGASLAHLVETGRVGEAAELGADTWLYWALRSNAAEGLAWLERIAAAAEEDPDAVTDHQRARLHEAVAGLRYASGDLAAMEAPTREALAIARRIGADELRLEALVLAASAQVFTGQLERARSTVEEALPLVPVLGGFAGVHAMMVHAQLLTAAGDLPGAADVAARAVAAARELGSPFSLAATLNMRATVAEVSGDDAQALDMLLESAELAREVSTTWSLVYTLPALAVQAAKHGQSELAAELFAAGSTTQESTSVAVSFPPDLVSAGACLLAVQEALGPEAFHRAWEAGRRLTPADVPLRARRISRSP